MAFVPRTEAEIGQALLARILAYTDLTDAHEGGVALELLLAEAKELARTEQGMQLIASLGDIDQATGEDLDERAAEALPDGELRQPAVKATSTVRFRRAAGDTVGATPISLGQVVARSSDGALYATTAAGSVADGAVESTNIPVIAQVAGSAGNAGVSTIDVVKGPPPRIIGVANYTTATGGLDEETDSSLRNRVRNKGRSLARCTPSAFDLLVRSYSNPTGQRVRFLRLVEVPPRADLWVDDGTGTLDAYETVASGEVLLESAPAGESVMFLSRQAIRQAPGKLVVTPLLGAAYELTLNTHYTAELPWGQMTLVSGSFTAGDNVATNGVYTAWTGLIADVQRLLDGNPYDRTTTPGCRGAGTATRVRPASVQLQTIVVDCTWEPGLGETALAAAVLNVTNAVLGVVNTLDIGSPLYLASLIDVAMEVAGVKNVKVLTPAADVYVAAHRVIRTTSALTSVR